MEIRNGKISCITSDGKLYQKFDEKQFSTYVTKYFDDLLQEGYMAVLEGLETYDVKRAKPTTFSVFILCTI